MEFRLYPVSMVFAGMVAYPFEIVRDVLQAYREVTSSAPDELSMYCSIMTEPEHGMRVVVVLFCWSGDAELGQQMIQPIMEVGTPVMTMAGPMPYAAFNSATDYHSPHGRRNYWKGVMVTDLKDGLIDQLESLGSDPPLPGQSVTIELYGGETSRIAAHATAYPHRDARYQVVINSQWDDPADDTQGRDWTRGVHSAIEPYAKRGQFLNFVNLDGDDRQRRIRAGYGDHWDRLVEIKRRYDPQNVFHRNNTITP